MTSNATNAAPLTAKELADARLRIAAARYLVATQTLFGDGVYKLALRPSDAVPTLATAKNWITRWSPRWALACSVEELAGDLVHELLHLLNRHFSRCGDRDPRAFNIAGDLAIEQTAAALGFPRGRGRMAIADFGLPPALAAEEYYDLLPKQGGGGGKGEKGAGDPQCGGCAGNPAPDEPGDGDAAGRGEAEGEAIARGIAEAVQREAAKGRGDIPADLLAWAGNVLRPPRVRWQDKLSRAVRNAVFHRRGAVESHFRGLSRRQWGVGVGPGRPMLPAVHAPVPLVWAFGDTSGSMGQGAGSPVEDVCVEIGAIARTLAAPIQFGAIDADLHGGLVECRDARDVAKALRGGGGTDFRPAFDLVARTAPNKRPSVLVYVTDGQGVCPGAPPAGVRVIWCLVGAYASDPPCTWGERIRVESSDGDAK